MGRTHEIRNIKKDWDEMKEGDVVKRSIERILREKTETGVEIINPR